MSNHNISKIVAVTVTYNIDLSFEDSLQSYLPQVAVVVIVDNSTERDAQKRIRSIAQGQPERIVLIQNGENLGLAKAQNLGIEYALGMDADWVLLMDDDSSAGPHMVEQLAQAGHAYTNDSDAAIIVPKYLEQSVKREAKFVTAPEGAYHWPKFAIEGFSGRPILHNLFIAISSGSLINVHLFDEIGLIRESFDIDYLDVDFCLRAISSGFRIIAVRDAELYHNLGEQTEHKFLGYKFLAWNHSAKRRFSIYRNRTRIWREYLFCFPGFVFFDVLAAMMDLFRIVMFEQQKSVKLGSVLKGVVIGLFSWELRRQPNDTPQRRASGDAGSNKFSND
ncbi:MAG: glycosyltransferase family 2 protein [Candidatus Thiodiazotropha sp.]